MIPTISRNVIVLGIESNGALEHPAVITRSFGGRRDTKDGAIAVNLTIFPDCSMPMLRSSVMLFESREEAQAYLAHNLHAIAAFWPERVSGEPPAVAAVALAA